MGKVFILKEGENGLKIKERSKGERGLCFQTQNIQYW
jgi:hypothetical protein